ncbi:hypothetical protein BGZ80_000133 [Entomortierella chlamydospora]|uniref:Uncharacterized protein n=1 Tax=Entomortierella chlamydospora TaxID=101097 RepID=A0A9P6MTH3_9FUNG|nr:hypothetical protein BGZ80_000133 [Entomortierella chlamydospora]
MQRRRNLAPNVSRERDDSVPAQDSGAFLISRSFRQSQEHISADRLPERVYRWSTNELDYRPENIDARTRNRTKPITDSRKQSTSKPEFNPLALERVSQSSRKAISNQTATISQAHEQLQRHGERQERILKCRDLTLAIALKQREITETKERIKRQRQLEAVRKIHLKQSCFKIRVLQEYEALFHQLRLNTLDGALSFHDNSSSRYLIKTTFERALGEVMRITKLVAIDGVTLQRAQVAEPQGVQDLHRLVQLNGDGATFILEIIKDLKEKSLQMIQSERQIQIQGTKVRNEKSEAVELLQLFREHHLERVVQIESVLNKIAACELEKEQLYSRMRFQAQRREQMKKIVPFLQELEETKAHLAGLGTALEFIQAEQENLVERVVSLDEQQLELEAMSKASRAADQKMTHLRSTTCKLIEMVRINCHSIPHSASEISGDITRSISEGLSQLSNLIQNQEYSLEDNARFLQNFTEKCQLHGESDSQILQPSDSLAETSLENGKISCPSWQEVATISSASADQYILQLAGLERQNTIHQLAVSRAKEAGIQMGRSKENIISMMSGFMKNLPEGGSGRNDMELSLDALTSKFEGDFKNIRDSLVKVEDDRHAAFQNDIQRILEGANIGDEITQKIRGLVEDEGTIAERLDLRKESSSEPHNKKMRYVQ